GGCGSTAITCSPSGPMRWLPQRRCRGCPGRSGDDASPDRSPEGRCILRGQAVACRTGVALVVHRESAAPRPGAPGITLAPVTDVVLGWPGRINTSPPLVAGARQDEN